MIIKICSDTKKLALSIVDGGCSGSQLVDDGVELWITSIQCQPKIETIVTRTPCEITTERREVPPVRVIYPALEVDIDGRIVFYLDDKLMQLKPGRYIGTVAHDNTPLISFDIDLCTTTLRLESVSTESLNCGGNKC